LHILHLATSGIFGRLKMQVRKMQVQIFRNVEWPTVFSWINKHF